MRISETVQVVPSPSSMVVSHEGAVGYAGSETVVLTVLEEPNPTVSVVHQSLSAGQAPAAAATGAFDG